MTVALAPLPRDASDWLRKVATAYFREVGPDESGPSHAMVADWFDDPETYVLLVTQAHRRVGFALVDRVDDHHELCEFSILPDFRDNSIGTQAAVLCFAQFPGKWALGVANGNPGTARFWDRTLSNLSGITTLARGPALTPYQSHTYTFAYKGAL